MPRCYACCQENCGTVNCTCDCHELDKPSVWPLKPPRIRVVVKARRPGEESPDWKRGVEDAIRTVRAKRRTAASFNTDAARVKPAFLAALDETLIHLESLRLRGRYGGDTKTENATSTAPEAAATPPVEEWIAVMRGEWGTLPVLHAAMTAETHVAPLEQAQRMVRDLNAQRDEDDHRAEVEYFVERWTVTTRAKP